MDMKSHAEARLEAAMAAAGLEDSRPALRARLKRLKSENPDAFEQAVGRYETEIIPALAEGPAPLESWLAFAATLGQLSGAGRLLAIDGTGRAAPYQPPYQPGDLILHVPDDPATPALAAALPQAASEPQQAACDLLLHGRLGR